MSKSRTDSMATRLEILDRIVHCKDLNKSLLNKLKQFSFDSEELVILELCHIASVLLRFSRGEIDKNTVHQWADAIEGRDDIGFQLNYESKIKQTIFELANPSLFLNFDIERALDIVQDLDGV